jgi:isftu1 transposase
MIGKAEFEILFLHPYSPDLNPIEKFWANFKRRVKKASNSTQLLQKRLTVLFVKFAHD